MPRSKPILSLSPEQQEQMARWLANHGTPQQVVVRCRIISLASQGLSDQKIATRLQVSRPTIQLWRERGAQQGHQVLWKVAPGRGAKATYYANRVESGAAAT